MQIPAHITDELYFALTKEFIDWLDSSPIAQRQIVCWRAAQVARAQGDGRRADELASRAAQLLAAQLGKLGDDATRARVSQVFRWNREILAAAPAAGGDPPSA